MLYTYLLKPLMFLLDAERAHHLTVKLLQLTLSIPGASFIFRALYEKRDARLRRQCFGLDFPNPVGLAAGFEMFKGSCRVSEG